MEMQTEIKNKLTTQSAVKKLKEKPRKYSRFRQWWKEVKKYYKDQDDYAHLLSMRSHEFNDIGITRYDVMLQNSERFPWPRF